MGRIPLKYLPIVVLTVSIYSIAACSTGGSDNLAAGFGGMPITTAVGAGGNGGLPTAGAGPVSGSGGRAGSAGASAGTGGKAGSGAAAGSSAANCSTNDLESVRQCCVYTINNYRATVNAALLKRATPEQEACSDAGAKKDGDANAAHGSAGSCVRVGTGLRGGQDACPNWQIGWSGATLGDLLTNCLKAMWDEKTKFDASGKTRAACQQDSSCFANYGHYLNMSDTGYTTVSCGFYQVKTNTWWMNQDF
jgi:hypothetical protein